MKIPELLAPAGSYDGLVSAVRCGADAVYLGLKEFSARKSAANFTLDELERGIYFAHLHGVKVYIALNTLATDDELDYVKNLAVSADSFLPDAFIIQDLGIASSLRNHVGAAFHASTQMTVINAQGVRVLSSLGFSRVVLARELSIPEISEICSGTECETEVFCHGALCMSYSGQCMMSRFSGNDSETERSGNRGSCSQPCRLKYSLLHKKDGSETVYPEGCRLSPSDLCSLPYLKELVCAGVSSLKIEGRLKRPEYAALVTQKYRKVLDIIASDENPGDLSDDIYDLSTQFSRSGFSSGHQLGKMPLSAITFDTPGHTGAYCGKTVSVPVKIPAAVPLYTVNARLCAPLKKGDSVFFGRRNSSGSAGSGNINLITSGKTRLDAAEKGSEVTLTVSGDLSKIRSETAVYRTQDGTLTKQLSSIPSSAAEYRHVHVNAAFYAFPGEKAKLILSDEHGHRAEVFSSQEASVSDGKAALSYEKIRNQIEKLGGTPFILKDFNADLGENIFLPLSAINEMRRLAAEKLSESRGKGGRI